MEYGREFKKITVSEEPSRAQCLNMNETSLLFEMVPNKTLAPGEVEEISGAKKQTERITVTVRCNTNGSFKIPLIATGKAVNLRSPKNLDIEHIPVWYHNQKSAWMDKNMFEEWVVQKFIPKIKTFLESENFSLNAVLLEDNCRSHKYLNFD